MTEMMLKTSACRMNGMSRRILKNSIVCLSRYFQLVLPIATRSSRRREP